MAREDEKFGDKAPPIGMDDDGNLNELKPGEKPPMPVIIDAPKPDGGDLDDYDDLITPPPAPNTKKK